MSFLETARHEFTRLKSLAERAFHQVDDDAFFDTLSGADNSLAIIVKHMAGNMRSRWRDFLTTDGEKPDRNRDTEFELSEGDSREALMARWEAGWQLLFETLDALAESDLSRTVHIRGEAHSAMEAIARHMTHYAYHVGQIVWLARHLAGDGWTSLSVPKGQSEKFLRRPDPYKS